MTGPISKEMNSPNALLPNAEPRETEDGRSIITRESQTNQASYTLSYLRKILE